MPIVQVNQLRKAFGLVVAVDNISFDIQSGEVFTIIGPNGAGKTTTLEMIEGLVVPDSGTVAVAGLNWGQHENQIKQMIGVQPQSNALFDILTVEENLKTFAGFYYKSRPVEEIMELINLTDHRNKRVKALSGGQKQRLAIGLAMINDPDILFLDEPTTGLDPQARRNIWDIVMKLKEMGKTTVLTTHYMEEAEVLSDRVCIVDQGKVVAIDSPRQLIRQVSGDREVNLFYSGGETAAARVKEAALQIASIKKVEQNGGQISIWTQQPEQSLYHLFQYTMENGAAVDNISIKEWSLEDVFIFYTGKEWRD